LKCIRVRSRVKTKILDTSSLIQLTNKSIQELIETDYLKFLHSTMETLRLYHLTKEAMQAEAKQRIKKENHSYRTLKTDLHTENQNMEMKDRLKDPR
jgi:hypothetical protein